MQNQSKKKMVCFDSQACLKCFSCAIGCSTENRVRLQRDKNYNIEKSVSEKLDYYNYITPVYSETGTFPNVLAVTALKHCKHCSIPQCLEICPTKAITKKDSGAVVIDEDLCVGCQACRDACPYDIPQYSPETGRSYKCILCYDRLDAGLRTACDIACPSVAIFSGDEDYVKAEAQKRVENYTKIFDKPFIAYGIDEINSQVGTLQYITIAPVENQDEYLIPKSPRSFTATARDVIKVGGVIAGAATLAAVGLHARHWKKNRENSPFNNKEEK